MFRKYTLISIFGLGLGVAMDSASYANAVSASQYRPQQPATTTSNQTQVSQSDSTTPATETTVATKKTYKDQPKCKEFSWVGPYIGVFGGGVWANSDLNTNAGVVTSSSYFTSSSNISSVSQNGTGSVWPNSPMAGLQVGNNLQTESGSIVYGGVIDVMAFHLSKSKSVSNVNYPGSAGQYSLKTAVDSTWLASLRGRIGFTSPNWPLLFLTGGVAITKLHVYNIFSDNTASNGVGGASNTKVKPGWIVGAGIEMPIHINWTVAAEYDYVHFGSNGANGFVTCKGGACAARSPLSTSANLNDNIVRIGLNYIFS